MHSKIPVNENQHHGNKLIDLQCKSADCFIYDASLYWQECSMKYYLEPDSALHSAPYSDHIQKYKKLVY